MWNVDKFDAIRISIASPADIRKWSFGEIKKPETINYRTHKPERDGLFCEKIFGPTHDWTCSCGKYKSIRYKGIKCERCGVEITRSKVRRERMGHIELASPVAHIWYSKGTPNFMALLLDISPKDLEKVIYFNSYIVLDPGNLPLMKRQLLSEKDYRTYVEKYGDLFTAKMGAEAIKELLAGVNLEELVNELKFKLNETPPSKRANILKRLEVAETFLNSPSRPEWMVMDCIPVIPPDIRPMVQLDGGRFATSDLNDLYRRVINRNNRLKKLIELGAPDIIIKNEKRMLQEAVNSLIDNGRRGRPVTGPGKRPLKSLNDMLKGKQGRFRQNLLGKRVDYSGRSVIVVGPSLKLHQCGLPKKMALELFKPFIMHKLVSKGIAHNIKSAKKMLERGKGEIWDLLEEVIHNHPVLLNRAPTLHRLGIQAFEPVLVEGKAIQISPLVCKPFNADFDGDQMAVHVPLLLEAQAEARILMLSSHNIFSPASGEPLMSMTQDMTLGCFYVTRAQDSFVSRRIDADGGARKAKITLAERLLSGPVRYKSAETVVDPATAKSDAPKTIVARGQEIDARVVKALEAIGRRHVDVLDQKIFGSAAEMIHAFDMGAIDLHTKHHVRIDGKYVETTAGRLLFNEIVPPELGFINKQVGKKQLNQIVSDVYKHCGLDRTARYLDDVKSLGFRYATRSGLSFSISELLVPKRKAEIISNAQRRADDVLARFNAGTVNREEKRQSDIDTWQQATDEVTDALTQEFKARYDAGDFNSVYMMANSGARGSMQQVRQLAGMRGLMSNPQGDVIDYPIKSNFRDGLTLTEYFISTYGARKGLVDTALRTADSGYLTRRLVDVSQDVIIREPDCNTEDGILVNPLRERRTANNPAVDEIMVPLSERIVGRIASADIVHPERKTVITRRNETIPPEMAREIELAECILPVGPESIGHQTADTVFDERTGKIIARPDMEITQYLVEHLLANRVEKVKVKPRVMLRSPLTCRSRVGICQMCYSTDLSTGRTVEIGETAGIVAAQSIGEPGTQLTMRTFHIGGIALSQKLQIKTKTPGTVNLSQLKWAYKVDRKKQMIGSVDVEEKDEAPLEKDMRRIVLEGHVVVRRKDGKDDVYNIPTGANLNPKITDGEAIAAGEVICDYNPNTVVSQFDGVVSYDGLLVKDGIVVSQDGKIRISQGDTPLESYKIQQGSYIKVHEGMKVDAGDVIAEKVSDQQAAIAGIKGRAEFFDIKIKNVRVISDSGIIYVVPENPRDFKKVEYSLPQGVKEFKDEAAQKYGVKLRVRSGNEVKQNDELLVILSEIDGKVKLSGKTTLVVKRDSQKEYVVPKDTPMEIDEEKSEVVFVTDVAGKVKILQPKASAVKTTNSRRVLVTGEKEYHIPLDANLLLDHLEVDNGQQVKAGTRICKEIPFRTGTDGVAEIASETRKIVETAEEMLASGHTVPAERTVMIRRVTIRNIKDLQLTKDSSLKEKIVDRTLAAPVLTLDGRQLHAEGEKISPEAADALLLVSPIGGYVKIKNEFQLPNLNAPTLKNFLGRSLARDVVNVKTGAKVAKAGETIDNRLLVDFDRNQLELGPVFVTGTWITVSNEFTLALRDIAPIRDKLLGKICRSDVFSSETGEVVAQANQVVNKELMEKILHDPSIKKIELIDRKIFDCPEGAQIKVKDGTQIKAGTELIMPTHLQRIRVIHKIEEYEIPQELELLIKNGEEVVEGQPITKPIPEIVSEIAGKVNCITKYNKKINKDVVTKITVYSGKEYEVPEGIPLKVKSGDHIEALMPLTGPIPFEKLVEKDDVKRISRVDHMEKKYRITDEMQVLVRDGQEVREGDKLAVLLNDQFESEKEFSEKVALNRRNTAYLKHYPVIPGQIEVVAGKKKLDLFEEIEFAHLKSAEPLVGKRVEATLVTREGEMIAEKDAVLDEPTAERIFVERRNLTLPRVILSHPGVRINYAHGEITFDERPANEITVHYKFEEPGVVKLEHRETKEGKMRTSIGRLIVQSGEAHQILDGAELKVEDGGLVNPGDILAKWGSSSKKTIDIIQGLPRVAELFEARKPKKEAIIAEFEGVVKRSGNNLYIESPTGERKHYKGTLGVSSNFVVFDGELVRAGYPLTDGNIWPKKLRKAAGVEAAQRYLVDEVQYVYRSQGVSIDDKHVEIIVRQMLRKIKINTSGDTEFLPRDVVTINEFLRENDRVTAAGGRPATGEQILQGITKASLTTDSFISAASFQETTRVLTQASIKGKIDRLRGLKENLIIGKLIPAGTGIEAYRAFELPEATYRERERVDVGGFGVREEMEAQVVADPEYNKNQARDAFEGEILADA